MSRVGNSPITIPDGVSVDVGADAITVKGKKGELSRQLLADVSVAVEDNKIVVKPMAETKFARSLWGTMRSNIEAMIIGVSDGFSRELEIQGVGYRAQLQGKILRLQLGFSHDVEFPVPDGVTIECPSQVQIVVSGADKQQVGQVASNIRGYRPPEPYKGKGVRYKDEYVLRKEGKKK